MPHSNLSIRRQAGPALENIVRVLKAYDSARDQKFTATQKGKLLPLVGKLRQWRAEPNWERFYEGNHCEIEGMLSIVYALTTSSEESLEVFLNDLSDTIAQIAKQGRVETVHDKLLFLSRHVERIAQYDDMLLIAKELGEIKRSYREILSLDDDLGLNEDYQRLLSIKHIFQVDLNMYLWSSMVEAEINAGGFPEEMLQALKQSYLSLGQVASALSKAKLPKSMDSAEMPEVEEIISFVKDLVAQARQMRSTSQPNG